MFPIYLIRPSANKDICNFTFPIWRSFIYFSCVITLERLQVVRGSNLALFLLEKKLSAFYCWVLPCYDFSSSHVWMLELDFKESWVPKNWCFWTVVLEKTLESPLDCKEIQSVHRKGNQSWIVIGKTDAKALILWPPDVKNWLIGNDTDAGKDWRQEEKGMTEDEMVLWHHRLGDEFE